MVSTYPMGRALTGVTVTVTDWLAEPPEPVQAIVYVAVVVRLDNTCDPDIALAPLQPPEAVQVVALVELQVSVEEFPDITDAGLAAKVMTGAGTGAFGSVMLLGEA